MSANFLFDHAEKLPASEAPLIGGLIAPEPARAGLLAGSGHLVAPGQLVVPGLDARERGILNGLAAYHLRYGKADEALALLQLSSRLWPNDRQTLRLLTQAFIAIGDYEAAEMTDAAYRRLSAPIRPNRIDHLRRAIIEFGRARLSEARAALQAFLSARGPENRGSF